MNRISDFLRGVGTGIVVVLGVTVLMALVIEVSNAAMVETVDVQPGLWQLPLLFIISMMLFFFGILPIPVGFERGKLKWVMWCGTGMHAHIVYWTDNGFQTLHPADRSDKR